VQRQIEAFAYADSSGANEQERIRRQIIGSTQFPLQELILLEGKRSRKIARLHWEVFAADEIRLNGRAVGRQMMQQSPEADEIGEARCVAQRWMLFAQRTEPTEKMGIAAQLRESVNLWEGSTEIGKEAAPDISIFPYCIGPQGEAKRLDMRFENLLEAGPRRVHEI
jgi:hypothetical protein